MPTDPGTIDAVAKLVEVVFSGMGAVGVGVGIREFLAPWQAKRLTKAKVDVASYAIEEQRLLAQGKVDEAKVQAHGEFDVDKIRLDNARKLEALKAQDRPPAPELPTVARATTPALMAEFVEVVPDPFAVQAAQMRAYQDQRRFANLRAIVALAANDASGQQASADPVDEDWKARWFQYAPDFSNEDLQAVWAKILSGEVKRPGSFSLRCLETVRSLSQAEARTFQSLTRFLVGGRFILRNLIPDGPRASLQTAIELADAGLMTGDMSLMYTPTFVPQKPEPLFLGSDLLVVVNNRREAPVPVQVPAWVLTSVGRELSSIVKQPADRPYVKTLVDNLRGYQGFEVTTTLYISRDEGRAAEPVGSDIFPLDPPAQPEGEESAAT